MRILFWAETFWPPISGVAILSAQYLPNLRKRGHQCIVLTTHSSETFVEDNYEGIPVYRFPVRAIAHDPRRILEVRHRIAEIIKSFGPDLVHIDAVGFGHFFYHFTARVHPTPLIVTLHGWASSANALVARTLRVATWTVGCSAWALEQGQQLSPEISARSSVIYNALVEPAISPSTLPQVPRLLCVGRLVPDKGFDVLIRALALVVPHYPEVRLTVAGDGPELASLRQQTTQLGLQDSVEFPGWISPEDVPALINTATAVVVPSRSEAFSLTALQAAMMKRPVVATRVGGLPEVIEHLQTGVLVEAENSDALAAGILSLLDQPDWMRHMGQAAYHRAKQVFDWQQHVDAYERLYYEIVGRHALQARHE